MSDIYTFSIQKYESEHKESLTHIIHELIAESKTLEWEHFGDFSDFEKYVDNPRNITYVAQTKSKVIGFILGYPQMKDNSLAVCINFVTKDYRRRGIGGLLKHQLEKEAVEQKFDYIQSDVDACNIVSVKMNLRAGWDCEYFADYDMYECKKYLKRQTQ